MATFDLTYNSGIRHIQNFVVNQVSRSRIIVSGSPCRRQISSRKIRASSLMCSSVLSWMKCAISENLSTMTDILVYPSDLGSPTMKSMDMEVKPVIGTSRGSNSPYFLYAMTLLC